MNHELSDNHHVFIAQFDATLVTPRHRWLTDELHDKRGYWTALMAAFLVLCMLAALVICTWQVEDWQKAQTVEPQPIVATDLPDAGYAGHVF